jgi:MFS family permease
MDKRLVTILLIVFVQMVGSGMILPLLPIFAQDEFGMSPTAISLLVSVFFAARIFDGLTGGNLVVAQAYITDITPPNRRAQALGLIGRCSALVSSLAPLLGASSLGMAGQDSPTSPLQLLR